MQRDRVPYFRSHITLTCDKTYRYSDNTMLNGEKQVRDTAIMTSTSKVQAQNRRPDTHEFTTPTSRDSTGTATTFSFPLVAWRELMSVSSLPLTTTSTPFVGGLGTPFEVGLNSTSSPLYSFGRDTFPFSKIHGPFGTSPMTSRAVASKVGSSKKSQSSSPP